MAYLQTELAVAGMRVGVPVVLGGVVGGIGMYVAVDAACKSFRDNPWISAAVGTLAGMGVGFVFYQFIK